jgi:hypothetical protein
MTIRAPSLRVRLRSLAVHFALGIASCAHGPDEAREPATTTEPELGLVKAKCVACHPLPEAHGLAATEFPGWKSSHQKRVPLSEEEWARIRRYLVPVGTP